MNADNLIPNDQRTPKELRENAIKGGKKSGEVRRRKKALKERMKFLLELPATDYKSFDKALLMGYDYDDIDNETILVISLFEKAISGDVGAFKEIRNLLGQDITSEELKLKKKEIQLKEKNIYTDKMLEGVTIIDDIKVD